MTKHLLPNKWGTKKIWIDLDNSPHVLFFNPIIKELKGRGYQLLITTRDYAQVNELADMFGLEYTSVGRHYGKNKFRKIVGLLTRVAQLVPLLLAEKPQLAFSHGSRSQYLTGWIMGIPSLVVSDYEYARGLKLVKPTRKMMPEVVVKSLDERRAQNIVGYPGIKEDVYAYEFVPDASILTTLGVRNGNIVVTIRPPAMTAHYHDPMSEILFEAIIEHIGHKPNIQMIIMPRTKEQSVMIKKRWQGYVDAGNIIIPSQVVNGLNLIWHSDMVMSGGGTMIREAAALNVPAYSFFSGKIGAVDRYLADKGRLVLLESTDDICNKIVLTHRTRPPKSGQKDRIVLHRIVEEAENMIWKKESKPVQTKQIS